MVGKLATHLQGTELAIEANRIRVHIGYMGTVYVLSYVNVWFLLGKFVRIVNMQISLVFYIWSIFMVNV